MPEDCQTKIQQVAFIKKMSRYQVRAMDKILFIKHQGVLKRFLTED